MANDTEMLERVVTILTHIRMRPALYFSSEVPAVQNYIYGFIAAFSTVGFEISKGQEIVWKERSWEVSSRHPIAEMQEKGMSEDEVIKETFTMMILTILRENNLPSEIVKNVHQRIRENLEQTQQDLENTNEESIYNNPIIAKETRERLQRDLTAIESLERDLQKFEDKSL